MNDTTAISTNASELEKLLASVPAEAFEQYEWVRQMCAEGNRILSAMKTPKGWLITGSKMYQDAVVTTEAMAERRIEERGSRDQSRKVPLVSLE